MANTDRPNGLTIGYTKHGGPPQLSKYYTAGTLPMYEGDIVDMTSGWVQSVTASTDLPIGICAAYCGSTVAGSECYLYDDLQNTVFIAQADTTQIAGTSLCGAGYDLVATVGTTAKEQSNFEIDVSGTCVGYLWVVDKVDRPDNAWGGNVDLCVELVTDIKARETSHISS